MFISPMDHNGRKQLRQDVECGTAFQMNEPWMETLATAFLRT
jgi:hypothetical protein